MKYEKGIRFKVQCLRYKGTNYKATFVPIAIRIAQDNKPQTNPGTKNPELRTINPLLLFFPANMFQTPVAKNCSGSVVYPGLLFVRLKHHTGNRHILQ